MVGAATLLLVACSAESTESGVLLDSDFGEGNDVPFALDRDRFLETEVENGEMVVRINDPQSPHLIRHLFNRSYEAVAFEASIGVDASQDGFTLLSIGCWNADAGYLVVFLSDGRSGEVLLMEVISEKTGERIPLVEPESTDLMDTADLNRLRIDCVGGGSESTVVSAWVNDVPLFAVMVDGDLGLDAFSGVGFWLGGDGVEYRIDDVKAVAERRDPPFEPAPAISR